MPTINLKKKKIDSKKDNNIHKLVYNTARWRTIRSNYIMYNPLCKECLEIGKVTPVSEVHHITPISTAYNDFDVVRLGFDVNNLIGLCVEHHQNKHKK